MRKTQTRLLRDSFFLRRYSHLVEKRKEDKNSITTAIIFDKKGAILSIAQNSFVKTHPYQAKLAAKVDNCQRIYLHAEIAAITKCKNINIAKTIVIFRYNARLQPVCAKPCPICMEAIKQTNIKTILHT